MAETRTCSLVNNNSDNSNSNSSCATDNVFHSLDPDSKNWQKVTFRCMIQDILGNELYTKRNPSKYSDRTIFYCITVPGENDWVRHCPDGSLNEFMTNFSPQKRTSRINSTASPSMDQSIRCSPNTSSDSPNPSTSLQERNNKISFSLVNYSYPIPSDTKNKSCLIKVYDEKLVEKLRVNDIVWVSGILEPQDHIDEKTINQGNDIKSTSDLTSLIDNDFEPAHDFPQYLVPRVHVASLRKLSHINPLLPETISQEHIDSSLIKLAHSRLSTILTQLLAGDSLTAEYIILSLISHIHRRNDTSSIGQFTLNVIGITSDMRFLIDKIYNIISKITTHSYMIEMSIANLNNLKFTPQKDYENSKMISGTLQMPDGMYILLNETALGEGQLTSLGTENLGTLSQIIRWQKHSYDFKYPVDIDTDLKILVLSEGKSILTVPYQVKLKCNSQSSINTMIEACDSVDSFLTEDLLNLFRKFVTYPRFFREITIPEEVEQEIQNDFASWRKRDEKEGRPLFSSDELSSYMTVARYITLSKGSMCLTSDAWKEACKMEIQRQETLRA